MPQSEEDSLIWRVQMLKLKLLCSSLLLVALVGCSTTPARVKTVVLIPPASQLVKVPETLSEEQFDITGDYIVSYTQLAKERNALAGRLNDLIQWLLDASASAEKGN